MPVHAITHAEFVERIIRLVQIGLRAPRQHQTIAKFGIAWCIPVHTCVLLLKPFVHLNAPFESTVQFFHIYHAICFYFSLQWRLALFPTPFVFAWTSPFFFFVRGRREVTFESAFVCVRVFQSSPHLYIHGHVKIAVARIFSSEVIVRLNYFWWDPRGF